MKLFLFFINVVKIYSLLLNQKSKYIISIRKVEYSHHLCVIFILGKINRYDLQHKSFFPQESRSKRRVTKWEIPGLFCLQLPLSLPLEERQWVKRLEMPRRPPHHTGAQVHKNKAQVHKYTSTRRPPHHTGAQVQGGKHTASHHWVAIKVVECNVQCTCVWQYTVPRTSHIIVQACSAVGESCAEVECGCS